MSCDRKLRRGSGSSGGKIFAGSNVELCSLLWCSPLVRKPACDCTHFEYLWLQVLKWSWNACRSSGCQAAPGCAFIRMPVDLHCPPLLYPSPPGVQEVEGVVQGEVGGLYPELWPDLWRTLRTAVNGPTASQATGNHLIWGCFCLASTARENFPHWSHHQRLLFDSSLVGLDSESSFWYLEGKCQKRSCPFHVEKQGYSHSHGEGQALSVWGGGLCVGMLLFLS